MNKQERWLYEHLSYELLMLRYTHKQLQVPVDTTHEQLVWNANYDAFAVYAAEPLFVSDQRQGPSKFQGARLRRFQRKQNAASWASWTTCTSRSSTRASNARHRTMQRGSGC